LSNYMCYRPKRSTVKVEWEWIGEGHDGDYNPDRESDEKLLRFTVLRKQGRRFEQIDDASYCTYMPTTSNKKILRMMLEYMYDEIVEDVRAGISIKKKCEHLSWIEPSWLNH